MPPKPRFKREEVIEAAYKITREKGISAVTANELKLTLGTSASPIFTLFSSIEEIKKEVRRYALADYTRRSGEALQYSPAFKQFGVLMVSYACEEPHLFRLLFTQRSETPCSFKDFLPELGEGFGTCIELIRKDYGLNEKEAKFLFDQNWLYCYGICVLCANGVCGFTPEELNQMLGRQFMATLAYIKSGRSDETTVTPERK